MLDTIADIAGVQPVLHSTQRCHGAPRQGLVFHGT